MKKAQANFPSFSVSLAPVQDSGARSIFMLMINQIKELRNHIVDVVNTNSIAYFSQNGEPSTTDIPSGSMAIWKDADATSGNPTHYLMYNDSGTMIKWSSDNTVP